MNVRSTLSSSNRECDPVVVVGVTLSLRNINATPTLPCLEPYLVMHDFYRFYHAVEPATAIFPFSAVCLV